MIGQSLFTPPPARDEKIPGVSVSFNVPPEVYDRMKLTAKEYEVSLSQFCRDAVKDFLKTWE